MRLQENKKLGEAGGESEKSGHSPCTEQFRPSYVPQGYSHLHKSGHWAPEASEMFALRMSTMCESS